ncbi:hypothetical protein [Acetilactobacillus jinshanensis]|uniref:Uncharacterized protein n=1 Tax=Acetilactobacillus jinshanensis TaxID=1720083 RepID=A0A4P6ZLI7_9LACO|nr:hypothetical protein [Acetilactobacillus jinshanensis]QBP18443.1 hypothetical protein ELX58_04680 [Acetilactobacillus jinshanensis]URL61315.1 hypothetical protein HGK75_04790 [uncultured bacterium]
MLTVKRKSTLGKAIVAYYKTPYGKRLIHHWLLSKAMIKQPHKKPKIMMVMLFANGIFKDSLAPENFIMWLITDYGIK